MAFNSTTVYGVPKEDLKNVINACLEKEGRPQVADVHSVAEKEINVLRKGENIALEKVSDEQLLEIMQAFDSDMDMDELSEDSEEEEDTHITDMFPLLQHISDRVSAVGPLVGGSVADPEQVTRAPEEVEQVSAQGEPSVPQVEGTMGNPPEQETFVWREGRPDLSPMVFTGQEALVIAPEDESPEGYFRLLANDKFYEIVIQETEAFAEEKFLSNISPRARITLWKNLTKDNFDTWLGLLYHMGNIQINRFEYYWNTSKLYNIPIFRQQMARDRWMGIMECLHFARNPTENEPSPADRLYKIRPLVNFFNNRMKEIYSPGKEFSLDESMILWRGRLIFRQFLKGKKHKYGIKLYILTTASGLVLRFLIYSGAGDVEVGGVGHTEKVVHNLLEDFSGKGHSVFMDNFYNSPKLARDLLEKGFYCTGTLRSSRRNVPLDISRSKLKKGEVIDRWTDDGICVMKWKDKREVCLISTEFGPHIVEIPGTRQVLKKPEAVAEYNKYMSGIDRFDQLLSYYISEHKTLKWYKKVGIHIFYMMLLNSHLLSLKFSVRKPTLWDFRHDVIEALLKDIPPPTPPQPRTPRNQRHFPDYLPFSEGTKRKARKQKVCVICKRKGEPKSVTTTCRACPEKPGLCILPCFEDYHEELGIL